MPIRRTTVSLLLAALIAGACAETVTTTTSSTPTTTVPTTTAPPTTTTATTTPPPDVSVAIEHTAPGLVAVVERLYRWAADPAGSGPPALPLGLVDQLDGLGRTDQVTVSGTAFTAALSGVRSPQLTGARVAVVTADDDVVLAVDAGAGWRIVGAHLSRFGAEPWYGDEPRMVFVIGSDARPGQNALRFRADSLHVLTAVPETGEGTILGFPRDSWVATPYGRMDKFTHTLASRGPEVVFETAQILTGLPLEGYVITGFAGFDDLVDAIGGFTFDVPFAMAEPKSKAYFSAGVQHFDGADALAFARNRTLQGGDFTRSFHQGELMKAALAAMQSRGIGVLPDMLAQLVRFTWTDLTAADLLTLGGAAYLLDSEALVNVVTPGRLGNAGGASVVLLGDEAEDWFADLADGVLDQ